LGKHEKGTIFTAHSAGWISTRSRHGGSKEKVISGEAGGVDSPEASKILGQNSMGCFTGQRGYEIVVDREMKL
jgi:hypothetical protein